jgi:hypothetical protein
LTAKKRELNTIIDEMMLLDFHSDLLA